MSKEIIELSIDSIIPDFNQPRKYFDELKIKELAESIKIHGLLQPILVRPIQNGKFKIVHGGRRWRACKLLGLKTIRAEVQSLTDKEALEIQLVENLQREDLNPIEEAETYQKMIDKLGYTHEEIAIRIGKSREYVTNKLRLLKLPDNIKQAIIKGNITEGHARALISLKDNEQRQEEVFNKILSERLSVRQTEGILNNVSRETSSDIPNNGLVVGVWVSSETYSHLSNLANSKKVTVEKLCSQIIEKEVSRYESS